MSLTGSRALICISQKWSELVLQIRETNKVGGTLRRRRTSDNRQCDFLGEFDKYWLRLRSRDGCSCPQAIRRSHSFFAVRGAIGWTTLMHHPATRYDIWI
jgi:hypothetical protein